MRTLTNLHAVGSALKPTAALAASAAYSFIGPVLPYGWLCTAMVTACGCQMKVYPYALRIGILSMPILVTLRTTAVTEASISCNDSNLLINA